VQQDVSDLRAQVRQAEAGALAARSRLSQALTAAGLSDTQTESGIAQAQAGLEAANARLKMTKAGARTQEVESSKNQVLSAQANFQNAKVNLERMRGLYADGALSKQQMELVQMQYDVAKAQLDTTEQQLSLVKAGARDEEIEAARTQVQQAVEGVRVAKSNRANKSLRNEDIKSARAGVAQADAALAYAKQQLVDACIASPIAGVVSARHVQPGEMANPGMPLMEIVALDTVYFEATVSEIDIAKIRVGQSVQVSVDALPGKRFMGSVEKIYPTANTNSRQFSVRVKVINRTGDLKPGMFARGGIEVAKHQNVVVVPKDALVSDGKNQSVYVVVNGVAHLRPITTGFETREEAEALSGVFSGDVLVTVGQDKLSDGVKVNGTN
jgi:RND family efflux transporter MFP subunit